MAKNDSFIAVDILFVILIHLLWMAFALGIITIILSYGGGVS